MQRDQSEFYRFSIPYSGLLGHESRCKEIRQSAHDYRAERNIVTELALMCLSIAEYTSGKNAAAFAVKEKFRVRSRPLYDLIAHYDSS